MATEYVTKRELEAMRTDMHSGFALLRAEMVELRGEVRGDIGELRGELGGLRGALGELRGEVSGLRSRIDDLPTTRKMWVANVSAMGGVAVLVLAAAQLS